MILLILLPTLLISHEKNRNDQIKVALYNVLVFSGYNHGMTEWLTLKPHLSNIILHKEELFKATSPKHSTI